MVHQTDSSKIVEENDFSIEKTIPSVEDDDGFELIEKCDIYDKLHESWFDEGNKNSLICANLKRVSKSKTDSTETENGSRLLSRNEMNFNKFFNFFNMSYSHFSQLVVHLNYILHRFYYHDRTWEKLVFVMTDKFANERHMPRIYATRTSIWRFRTQMKLHRLRMTNDSIRCRLSTQFKNNRDRDHYYSTIFSSLHYDSINERNVCGEYSCSQFLRIFYFIQQQQQLYQKIIEKSEEVSSTRSLIETTGREQMRDISRLTVSMNYDEFSTIDNSKFVEYETIKEDEKDDEKILSPPVGQEDNNERNNDENICCICLNRKIDTLLGSCIHGYCFQCILMWSKWSQDLTCPMCRNKTELGNGIFIWPSRKKSEDSPQQLFDDCRIQSQNVFDSLSLGRDAENFERRTNEPNIRNQLEKEKSCFQQTSSNSFLREFEEE
ncbi:hypothetical protein SNEBB_010879 [Seison nebaliae]|nr:hypothetical protein SNEBB_010879 [Seison nebaliae]